VAIYRCELCQLEAKVRLDVLAQGIVPLCCGEPMVKIQDGPPQP
jgi:hypothetical protein